MSCGLRVRAIKGPTGSSLSLMLHFRLQFIVQLVLNRAGAEFMDSLRKVIFYRVIFFHNLYKLYMLLFLYGLPLRLHNCAYAAWACDALRQENR